jgi:hypothetical protein
MPLVSGMNTAKARSTFCGAEPPRLVPRAVIEMSSDQLHAL